MRIRVSPSFCFVFKLEHIYFFVPSYCIAVKHMILWIPYIYNFLLFCSCTCTVHIVVLYPQRFLFIFKQVFNFRNNIRVITVLIYVHLSSDNAVKNILFVKKIRKIMIQTTAVFYDILYINGNVLYPKVHLKMTIGFPKVYLYKHILLNSKVCIPVPF